MQRTTRSGTSSGILELNTDGQRAWITANVTRDTVDVGTIRTCKLPRALMGRTTVREELTEYEPGHAFAYRLEEPAGPFASAASRWSTSGGSDGATIMCVEGFFTARNRAAEVFIWPLARPMLRRLTGRVMAELEGFVVGQSDNPRP